MTGSKKNAGIILLLMSLSVIISAIYFSASGPTEGKHSQNSRDSETYSFKEKEVFYRNDFDGITLAATLAIPDNRLQMPAVILVGNGVGDRDLSVGPHRTFKVISDHLVRQGIAVLRYDGRGVGKSGGKPWPAYTKQNLATDLRAAFRYVQSLSSIDRNHIGIIGHSEGGTVAAIVAAGSDDVAFVVMLGSPGLPGGDVLCAQISCIAPLFGVDGVTVAKHVQLIRQASTILRKYPDDIAAKEELILIYEKYKLQSTDSERESLKKSGYTIPDNSADFASGMSIPWTREFLVYDPRPVIGRIRCPVLSLIGSKDMQVSAKENNSAIREALIAGGNRDFLVKELDNLNHLLQSARTGSPLEYEQINETIAPITLKTMSDWILRRVQ